MDWRFTIALEYTNRIHQQYVNQMFSKLFNKFFKKTCQIDWDLSREQWIASVLTILVPKLERDQRFYRGAELISRFHTEIQAWRRNHKFRPVIEFGNELAAAECLLEQLGPGEKLIYEPAMKGTAKRIDFLKLGSDGSHNWIEVKTVSPQWKDDDTSWQRFLQFAKSVPENVMFLVKKEFSGAAISGQAINARRSFIQRTIDVESRLKFIPDYQKGQVKLMFCSTGSNWYRDELEDFIDFYRTGSCRDDDWLVNVTNEYMIENQLCFDSSLAGFCYLARRHEDVSAHSFTMNV